MINFIDIQHGQHFSFKDKQCLDLDLKQKKIPIVSRLNFNDIITHNFKLERHLTHTELLITSELKMVDEIGLDASRAHKISYATKNASTGSLKLVESFAIDKDAITQKYQEAFSKVKHLDYLAIPFLIFETLYTHQILEKHNDLFITLDDDESFSSFYKEGTYLTSKKMLSLNDMVIELKNQNISLSLSNLKETLLGKGLIKENYSLEHYDIYDYFLRTFTNFLSKMQSIAIHNRNVYGFTKVERIFFSLEGKLIPGFDILAKDYFEDVLHQSLDLISSPCNQPLDVITAIYSQDKILQKEQHENFTIYERKNPFYKSEVGKLALASLVATIAISSYPSYQLYNIQAISDENSVLQTQLDKLTRSTSKLKKTNTSLKKEIIAVKKKQETVSQDFHKLQNVATALLALKSKDSKYTPMFMTINMLLKDYKLSVDNIKQVGAGAIDFEVFSTDNKRDTIAKFMRALLNEGYSSVSSNEIVQDETLYKSIITVKK